MKLLMATIVILTIGIAGFFVLKYRVETTSLNSSEKAEWSNSKKCKQSGIDRDGDAILICGYVNIGDAAVFTDLLNSKIQTRSIVIASTGGEVSEFIEIARQINLKSIPVYIYAYCLSACANFVMLSAETITVASGTLVAFHRELFAQYKVLSTTPNLEKYATVEMQYLANISENFYDEFDISKKWILKSFWAVQPSCYGGVVQKNGISNDAYVSKYHWWVPSRKEIEGVRGRAFQGYWPNSSNIEKSILDAISALGPNGKVLFGRVESNEEITRKDITLCDIATFKE